MPHQPDREILLPTDRIFGEGAAGGDLRLESRFSSSESSFSSNPMPIPPPPPLSEVESSQLENFIESFGPPEDPRAMALRALHSAEVDTSDTSAIKLPDNDLALNDPIRLLTIPEKDYLLVNLIAGRTVTTIRRYFRKKFSKDLTPRIIRKFEEHNAAVIIEGRAERYSGIKKRGLALAEERVLQLSTMAETLQAEMQADMAVGNLDLRMFREYREHLDDIAEEVGHRRKGLDVDAGLVVSVIQGPIKATTEDEWEQQVSETLTVEAEAEQVDSPAVS